MTDMLDWHRQVDVASICKSDSGSFSIDAFANPLLPSLSQASREPLRSSDVRWPVSDQVHRSSIFDFDDRYPSPSSSSRDHPLSHRPKTKKSPRPPLYFMGDHGDSGRSKDVFNRDVDALYVRISFNFMVPIKNGKAKATASGERPQAKTPIVSSSLSFLAGTGS